MKKITFYFLMGLSVLLASCTAESDISPDSRLEAADIGSFSSGNGQNNQSGLITAGEWNDLDNWSFWNDLINGTEHADKPDYWNFYPNNRISVLLTNSINQPVINARLDLMTNGEIVWTSRTDNYGKAEVFIDLFQLNPSVNLNNYALLINGQQLYTSLKTFDQGVNKIILQFATQTVLNKVELGFIVDATGSMGDELEFLKDDLADVIQSVKNDIPGLQISTSSVFYRDEGDEYVVKKSDFSTDLGTTLNFINNQSADGGGDTPEAVHTAMQIGIEQLQWSDNARTRIAFLLLDAPPHYEPRIIGDLQHSIQEAAKKGIKVIPITASGIDKETEFLMRFFSISTNGTYVFITDTSGIGEDHLEASVGAYEEEFLNDLMVRLIKKYSQ